MDTFNLSLDDYSPHPKTGLYHESIFWCKKLISHFPDIKINLFVPAAYCRLGEIPNKLLKNKNWVDEVKKLNKENFSIGIHGFFHRRSKKDYVWNAGIPESNNDEFQYLKKDQAIGILKSIESEFKSVGLQYNKIFRPPGWKISKEAALVFHNYGFVIAGDEKYYNLCKDIPNLKWVCYNWDLFSNNPPENNVIAYGHTSEWTKNYFNEEKYNWICDLLRSRQFCFKFLEEI